MKAKLKAKLIKAYLAGIITKDQFIDYLEIHPGAVIIHDGKFQSDADEKKVDIFQLIGFDLLIIDIFTLKT